MDKIWMTVRYVVAGLGAGLVGFGLSTAEDVAGAISNLETIFGAGAALVAYGVALKKKLEDKF